MGRKQAYLWFALIALLLVLVPSTISEIHNDKQKISKLESQLSTEKASHEKDTQALAKEKEKTKSLQATVENQVADIESMNGELSVAKDEAAKAKQEAATAKAEVERLKKAKASAVKNPPVEQQAAPTLTAEKPSGNGGRKVTFIVTAYGSDCAGCTGKTASGTTPTVGRTIAASSQYPFGTKIEIPELGGTFVVEDRGGAIQGNKLDLYYGTEGASSSFGVKVVEGYVYD